MLATRNKVDTFIVAVCFSVMIFMQWLILSRLVPWSPEDIIKQQVEFREYFGDRLDGIDDDLSELIATNRIE